MSFLTRYHIVLPRYTSYATNYERRLKLVWRGTQLEVITELLIVMNVIGNLVVPWAYDERH